MQLNFQTNDVTTDNMTAQDVATEATTTDYMTTQDPTMVTTEAFPCKWNVVYEQGPTT